MIEAVANPLSDKFDLNKKKLVGILSVLGAGICIVFATPVAACALDIADHFANYFNILILGIAECFILGMYAKPVNLAGEINRYTGKFKMPARPLVFSLKYLSPVALSCLTMWGVYHLIFVNGGLYGGYPLWMQAVFGWALSIIVFASGFIICGFVSPKMRRKQQRLRRKRFSHS